MEVVRMKISPENTLKALRRSAGLTQAELSEKAGISLRTLTRYESGENDLGDLPVAIAHRMADILGVDIHKLIDGISFEKQAVRNTKLSLEGLGLYATLASFRKSEILLDRVRRYTDDADATVNAALKELEDAGYIEVVDIDDSIARG